MSFEVRYSDEAFDQLKALRAVDRAAILDRIERVLMSHPTTEGQSRIKLLRQPAPTQYRLRVNDFRVFYDVEDKVVSIAQVLSKTDSRKYLGEKS